MVARFVRAIFVLGVVRGAGTELPLRGRDQLDGFRGHNNTDGTMTAESKQVAVAIT